MKKIILIGLMLLILILPVYAETRAVESEFTEEFGVISVEYETKTAFEKFFGGFQQAIRLTPGIPKVGEETEAFFQDDVGVPTRCPGGNPFSTIKYHIKNLDTGSTVTKDKSIGNCQSLGMRYKFTPSKVGNYEVAYTIFETCSQNINDITPGIVPSGCIFAVADKLQFNVQSGSSNCPDDFCEDFKITKTIPHGKYQERSCTTYEGSSCTPNTVVRSIVLSCDAMWAVSGSTQQVKQVPNKDFTCVMLGSDDDGSDNGGSDNGNGDIQTCSDFPNFPECECITDNECNTGEVCNALKQCYAPGSDSGNEQDIDFDEGGEGTSYCGDGICDFDEDAKVCPNDCIPENIPKKDDSKLTDIIDNSIKDVFSNADDDTAKNIRFGLIGFISLLVILIIFIIIRNKRR
ncbi:MAG: hypothetical protein Q8P20_07885 [bacterium]|nr:hypothetical protein [bacterium]